MAGVLGTVGAFAAGLLSLFGQQALDPSDYTTRTHHLLQTTPLIDGHNDLPYLLRLEIKNKIYDGRFTFDDRKHRLLDDVSH